MDNGRTTELPTSMTETATQALHHAGDAANSLARQGADLMRHTSHDLQERAQRVSRQTTDYIQQEPVKAMLMAAAAGAVLMTVLGWLARSRTRE
jgi:ElaB/YqjD/DUF883 family membrane-anchored ribosome-binding protein